jgi:hypothetical protein
MPTSGTPADRIQWPDADLMTSPDYTKIEWKTRHREENPPRSNMFFSKPDSHRIWFQPETDRIALGSADH